MSTIGSQEGRWTIADEEKSVCSFDTFFNKDMSIFQTNLLVKSITPESETASTCSDRPLMKVMPFHREAVCKDFYTCG